VLAGGPTTLYGRTTQPWSLALFKPGFLILLYSTLAYTVLSHVTPRDRKPPSASA